jgi:hypothetical protein
MIGHLHTLIALFPEKEPAITVEYEIEWAAKRSLSFAI